MDATMARPSPKPSCDVRSLSRWNGWKMRSASALAARLNSDGTVSVTDTTTGNVLATLGLPAPQNSISADPRAQTAMAFTSDGHALLTATMGGQVFRWTLDPQDLTRSIYAAVGPPADRGRMATVRGGPAARDPAVTFRLPHPR